jgi:hypothetical protein
MDIRLTLSDRIGREAERLAAEEGVPLAEFCAEAVRTHVKQLSQQRAIAQIDALLGAEPVLDRLHRPRRA